MVNRPVPGFGPIPALIMLVGERPGKDEDRKGRPFVGRSGEELDRYLDSAANLERSNIYLTNLVKDYQDADPTMWEIRRDEGKLIEELRSVNPTYIGSVGRFSTRWFLGDVDMETVHGIPHPVRLVTGKVATVIPLYHPAQGLYNPDSMQFIWDDFRQLGRVIRGKVKMVDDEFPSPKYREVNFQYFNNAEWVATDTEGMKDRPWGLTFTNEPGRADCIRYRGVRPLCNIDDKFLILHNSLHDLGVLRAMGIHVKQFIDTMVLAYNLCLEPQGLKPLAYRHCRMIMDSYDDVIGEVARKKALEYLMDAADLVGLHWPPPEPYLEVVIKNGMRTIVPHNPQSISKRVIKLLADYHSNPAETDLRDRWNNIDKAVKEPVVGILGPMPEATLFDVDEGKAVHYACRDADATKRILPVLWAKIKEEGLEQVTAIDHSIIPMVDRMQEVGIGVDVAYFGRLAEKCDRMMDEILVKIKKEVGIWVNPNSGDQVADLLFDRLGLPSTKLTKSKMRGSTNDKVLEGMYSAHPVVGHIVDYREVSKVKDSFAVPIPLLAGEDKRVRGTIRVTRVTSGRLAMSHPNLMAIPIRSDLGREVRQGFVAGEGKEFGTWDLDQIEMRIMADESGDEELCRLFNTPGKDVHSETAAKMFGIKVQDVHPIYHRYPAKRTGFGVITGITGAGLVDQMALARAVKPDGQPWTEADCDEMINEWFAMYPGVRSYMDRKRAEARRYGRVRDMWGRIRYLPGALSSVPRIREEALRQSHSHAIQGGAQGLIKIAMANIWGWMTEQWWKIDKYDVECLLQVHDELMFEFEEGLGSVIGPVIVGEMCSVKKLKVPVKAKGATGKTWASLEK